MHGPREYKRIINRIRKKNSKRNKHKNGALGFIDSPWIEKVLSKRKEDYKWKINHSF